ncbi:HNH/endonuclease VII fold putative polymorphic toxin, partial [Vibrio brasiliensis]
AETVLDANATVADKVVAVGGAFAKRTPLGKVVSKAVTKETPPANLSPLGAGRTGAFKEAKRQSGIPTSQQPSRVGPNLDKRGKVQSGKSYEFEVPAEGGGTKTVKIRDDAGGHDFGPGNPQNRGSHFNNEAGDHFDY